MGVVGSLQSYIALLLGLAALAMEVFALVDALRHRADAFTAAGKRPSRSGCSSSGVAVAIGFVAVGEPARPHRHRAVVAAAVYLADVRPALRRITRPRVVRPGALRLLVSLAQTGPVPRWSTGPGGALEVLTTGSGLPSTVFAHGLAGSIETTRPFGSGVAGSRTFFSFRGHGASAAPETDWTYAALAAELDAVARHAGATRALGVSMGAGALCSLLEQQPDRFDRLVLVIPAVVDRPRSDAAMDRLLADGRLRRRA